MFYTITGLAAGGLVTFFLCRLLNVSNQSIEWFPSSQSIFVFVGSLIGGGIGLGIGSTKLANGTYLNPHIPPNLFILGPVFLLGLILGAFVKQPRVKY